MAYKPYVDNKLSEKLDKPTQYLDDSLISPNIARSSEVSEVDGKVSGLSAQVNNLESTKGTYSKPSGGIPSTDLSADVQQNLSKAAEIYEDYIEASNLI